MIANPTFRSFLTYSTPVAAAVATSSGAAWSAVVVDNGGATIGTTNQTAVTTFIDGLATDSLTSKMVCCVFFESSSIQAATTPFYFNNCTGSKLWQNIGFTASADLTVDGLRGAAGKYLKTGVTVPNNTAIITTSSFGISMMYPTNSFTGGANEVEFGATQTSLTASMININFGSGKSGDNSWVCDNWTYTMTPGRFIYQANWTSNYHGMSSMNRTSATAEALYFGSTARAWSTLKSQTGEANISIPPTQSFYVFTRSNPAGNAGTTSKRFSFMAIHAGLSSADAQSLFNRAQTLRTSFGGGKV